jgi:protein ImuB
MFACIHRQSVPKSGSSKGKELLTRGETLIDLAFTFSPLVEQTTADTVVLDIEGCGLLFGAQNSAGSAMENAEIISLRNSANVIVQQAAELSFKVNVAIAGNPDAAIHAARNIAGVTIVFPGEELTHLGGLPLKALDFSLAGIAAPRAEEIRETLTLWGLRTFGELAKLPLAGISQRLGQEGVRLQKLAQGRSERHLVLVQLPTGFEQSIELEHPITELEPLAFIFARLLNQLCSNLSAHALATNELRLRLKLENGMEHERTMTLPVPMRHPRTFLRLLLLDMESYPPQASITAVAIAAEPTKPRGLQSGLFIPLAPEPEKLELTLARLAKLVGSGNVGSPELLDTHRPDAFRMKRFSISHGHNKSSRNRQSTTCRGSQRGNPKEVVVNRQCVMGFRVFRPPWRAEVQTIRGRPIRINARGANSSCLVRGKVICASGPWRTSGDWWRVDVWARDEWDVAVADSNGGRSEMLCRIYRDLSREIWFVEGMYD